MAKLTESFLESSMVNVCGQFVLWTLCVLCAKCSLKLSWFLCVFAFVFGVVIWMKDSFHQLVHMDQVVSQVTKKYVALLWAGLCP
jgi:hypothetical protein